MVKQKLDKFFSEQWIFSLLSVFLVIYLAFFLYNHFVSNVFISSIQAIGGLFFLLFGFGIGATLVLQWILKRKFDFWEFISLALLSGLTIAPLLLIFEFSLLKRVYDWYPIANLVVSWMIIAIILFFKKTSLPKFPLVKTKELQKNPFLWIWVFGVAFTLIQTLMYPVLPDLDPYKWLFKYTYQFSGQVLDLTERPLFGAFVFMVTRIMGISILQFFKYVLPFFYLLALFPAWLVARGLAEKKTQWMFLLFIFVSPVAILYAQTAMPQASLILLSYFLVFFLIYAFEKSDDFFFYAAGFAAVSSFLYHQAGSILFASWLFIFLISKSRLILKDKKSLAFITLLLITNLQRLKPYYNFVFDWIGTILRRMFIPGNFNPFYPAYYTNVDRNDMGWGSINGVVKFYAFHTGPILAGVLVSFSVIFVLNSKFRIYVIGKIKSSPALWTSLILFLVFFTIAEILPRFPNVALLPDRAWIFAGIFSFVFLYLTLKFYGKVLNKFFIVFILLFSVGISGALYINYLKRYLITPGQFESAQWIKENLPENRLLISYGHKGLLPVYAESDLARISPELYCGNNLQLLLHALNDLSGNESRLNWIQNNYLPSLKEISVAIDNSFDKYNKIEESVNFDGDLTKSAGATLDALSDKASNLKSLLNTKTNKYILPSLSSLQVPKGPVLIENVYNQEKIPPGALDSRPLYIYYAKENSLNPYYSRPYDMKTWGMEPCPDNKFLFDLYPDKFRRIYSTNKDEVIIWKIL